MIQGLLDLDSVTRAMLRRAMLLLSLGTSSSSSGLPRRLMRRSRHFLQTCAVCKTQVRYVKQSPKTGRVQEALFVHIKYSELMRSPTYYCPSSDGGKLSDLNEMLRRFVSGRHIEAQNYSKYVCELLVDALLFACAPRKCVHLVRVCGQRNCFLKVNSSKGSSESVLTLRDGESAFKHSQL